MAKTLCKITLAARRVGVRLTPRQVEVLRLRFQGHPCKVVADRLGISESMVKKHSRDARERAFCSSCWGVAGKLFSI